jgi:anti-sigma factor ChrR (cupin superfamily)
METDRLQELAALHAVGALDGEDLIEFRRLLAEPNHYLRQEAAAFSNVAAVLAESLSSIQAPPPALKDKILQKIASQEAARKSSVEAPGEASPAQSPGFHFIGANETGGWINLPVPGAAVKVLSMDPVKQYVVLLGKLEPGAHYPAHKHLDAEEVYVLSGDLHIGDRVLKAGDFHHADAGTAHDVNFSEQGCTILAILSARTLQAQFAEL